MSVAYNIKFYKKTLVLWWHYISGLLPSARVGQRKESAGRQWSSVGRVGWDLLDRNWWGRQHPVQCRRACHTTKKKQYDTAQFTYINCCYSFWNWKELIDLWKRYKSNHLKMEFHPVVPVKKNANIFDYFF